VKFAKKHRTQVSIKNSGHSYSGQSSRKDSIQLISAGQLQYDQRDGIGHTGRSIRIHRDNNNLVVVATEFWLLSQGERHRRTTYDRRRNAGF